MPEVSPVETPVQSPTIAPAPMPEVAPGPYTDPYRICPQQKREMASPDVMP